MCFSYFRSYGYAAKVRLKEALNKLFKTRLKVIQPDKLVIQVIFLFDIKIWPYLHVKV